MSAFSNKSFSHYRCVEAALPFSAVAQRLLIGGKNFEAATHIIKLERPGTSGGRGAQELKIHTGVICALFSNESGLAGAIYGFLPWKKDISVHL